jgi:hypothetical protein
MELRLNIRSLISGVTDLLRSWLPCGMQLTSCPQTAASPGGLTRLPLVQHVARLLEQMSECVVVCYDKELRATFRVTPPLLDRCVYG